MTDHELTLRIYDGSISTREHRELRRALSAAAKDGTTTLVGFPGGKALIVPVPTRKVPVKPTPFVTEAGETGPDGVRRAWCMGSAPHAEHEFNGGDWCPGLAEITCRFCHQDIQQEIGGVAWAVVDREGHPHPVLFCAVNPDGAVHAPAADSASPNPAAEPVPAAPRLPLEWHKGKHGWHAHGGYRRHSHSLNGVLTIDPRDPSPHFQGGAPFAD